MARRNAGGSTAPPQKDDAHATEHFARIEAAMEGHIVQQHRLEGQARYRRDAKAAV
jgi:hypothetical protein